MVVKPATTFIKRNMNNIWTVVLAVYTIVSCIPAVTSQEQPAFSLAVSVMSDPTVNFNFTDVMFHKFYHCLRNRNNDQCEIQRDDYNNVISVRGCLPGGNTNTIDELTCKVFAYRFVCKRGSYSDDEQIMSCPEAKYYNYEIKNNDDLSTTARTTWLNIDNMVMESHIYGITIERLNSPGQNYKFAIRGTFTTTLLPPPPPTTTTATKTTTKLITAATTTTTTRAATLTTTAAAATTTTTRMTTASTTKTSTTIPSGSLTTAATNYTDSPGQKSDDGDENIGIIIGAAVGGAVVVVIIIIIVVIVIVWRRNKKTSASPATTNNNQYEDTDIYPYGEFTRPTNSVHPNLNSNNLNHNSNQPTPDVYAIVDPSKKLNKTSSSDVNNANSNNQGKSQEGRPYSNGSIDYTEVNIDNGAVHYQRSSDANNGQEIPTSEMPPPFPSDPSAKPNHYNYNVYSETGKDPCEPYTQVVKKNKMEEEHAASEEGEGSSPAPDPSGYEEAVPCTDTQYTTVMDSSAKNKLNPAPDGVYAKLHDPVRKITDVYNEGPVTVEENAGE